MQENKTSSHESPNSKQQTGAAGWVESCPFYEAEYSELL